MSHLYAATSQENPVLEIETRPSNLTGFGFAWYAVLRYREHAFEGMLPVDWPSMDEVTKSLALAPIMEELRAKLAPILIAEDSEPAESNLD